jgi:hypothetical protein
LSNGLLIQVTNEKAIYLEKRPSKTPVIRVRKLNYARNDAGDERPQSGRESPALWLRGIWPAN